MEPNPPDSSIPPVLPDAPESSNPSDAPEAPKSSTGRKVLGGVLLVLGALSVLGYMAVQKTRRHSEDTSVLCNVRQLSAAADQYFLENGVSTTRLDKLIGPGAYIGSLQTVNGETYPVFFTQGITITVTGIAGSRTVTYAP